MHDTKTYNSVVKASGRGPGAGWRWEKGREMGTPVIVFTIKFQKRVERFHSKVVHIMIA